MIRGTTASYKFRLPYNFTDLSVAKIIFWQNNYYGLSATRPLPIKKVLSQCSSTNEPNELLVTLTKEETLRFTDARKAYVQLQAKTTGGLSFASRQIMITVYPVRDDSIWDDDILPTPLPDENDIIYLDGSSIIE